ncbi:hypothetical protein ACJ41O_007611 [Fusarium nematophilum]
MEWRPDLPFSRILSTVLAVLFLAGVGFKTLFPGDDPYRCRAVLKTGRWIDHPDKDGHRDPFHIWQPDGCLFHKYSSPDIRRCLEGRRIVTIGDSTSRGVAHGFGRLLERAESNIDRGKVNFKPFNVTYHGVQIQRLPNVWLDIEPAKGQNDMVGQVGAYSLEVHNPPKSIKEQKGPAIVYIAAAVWYTNIIDDLTADQRMARYREAFSNVSDLVGPPARDIFTAPMHPVDGFGNQVFYAPPAGPSYQGHKEERLNDTNRRMAEVHEMQDWLRAMDNGTWNLPMAWAIPATAVGQNHTWKDPYGTGFHVKDGIAETRAGILLNMRCNAKLDREKPYPYERTCCTDYGGKPFVQLGVVCLCLVYLVACIVCEVWDLLAQRDEPRFAFVNMQAGTFVLAVLMCYYADRTQMMAKGAKLWSLQDFFILCAPCVAIALMTIRKSRSGPKKTPQGHVPLASEPDQQPLALTVEEDKPFLSRDQTDEWKGWMQFFILIYHWVNSQSATIYVFIRLLVAAYLFQTGYGHTLFFLNKKDFSFSRAAAVVLRLNLLSCSLAYVMNTDWMFYYFSPLVTFWFLVVYATMAIGHKRYNSDIQLVLAKICVSALLISTIVLATPATRWTFTLLRTVFNIQWSYNEWQYRVSLDIFVVYVGMLVGVANFEMERRVNLGLRVTLAVAGLMVVWHYFYATSRMTTNSYKVWHPYVSFVPVLAFVAMRNVSGPVRNYHSKAMAWIGRCSLETYTLQFHLLLAADTKGILIVDGFFGDGSLLMDRWRSLIIIVPVFLWISSVAATATAYIVKVMLRSPEQTEKSPLSRFAWAVERIPGSEHVSAAQIRVTCIILMLWLLNLLSPSHVEGPAPDGFTPHRAHLLPTARPAAPATPVPTPE